MIHRLLEPLFQPIFDREGQVYAYEALMRLRGHTISPARMVKRWERSGYIKTADLAMLRRLAEMLAGIAGPKPRIAVNVSIATIEAAGDDYVAALIELAPHVRRLIVELTETAAVSDASALLRFSNACRVQGFIVALDDCRPGHPYGSASFIKSFRPHLIKIDGEYLQRCFADGGLADLVDMIEVAHSIDARVIAEYVSSPELFAFALRMGVDYSQGFALGEPAPLAAVNGNVYTLSFSS